MKILTIIFLLSFTQLSLAITEDAADCGLGGSTTLMKIDIQEGSQTFDSTASEQ